MHLTNLSNWLLAVIILIIWVRLLREIYGRYQRAKKQDRDLARIGKEWIDHTYAFAEWRSNNQFTNFEHPCYQWYIRKEVEIFQDLLHAKKGLATSKDREYLANLRWQIQPHLPVEEPPKE